MSPRAHLAHRAWLPGLVLAAAGFTPLAWSAPAAWLADCPTRIAHSSDCHLLPSEGRMALRVPMPGHPEGLWGFVDVAGRMVIAPAYDAVEPFSNGLAAARRGERWGYLDLQGQWHIQPRFEAAAPFDAQGAWAVADGQLLRLDREGQGRPVLTTLGAFELATPALTPQGRLRVQVRPGPQAWALPPAPGAVTEVRWPPGATQVGEPQGEVWPVAVKLPSGRTWWGLWSAAGEWLAKPTDLQSVGEPIHHAGRVAVQAESTRWQWVDLQGRPIRQAGLLPIVLDRPGTWVAALREGQWTWLDSQLQVLHEAQRPFLPTPSPLGDALVYELDDTVLLSRPGGQVVKLAADGRQVAVHPEGLWLLPQPGEGQPDLIGPDGRSLLSAAVRDRLRRYRIDLVSPPRPEPRQANAALALLTPLDAHLPPALLTAEAQIVASDDWVGLTPGETPTDLWVVQAADGRYGAIDGHGQWRLPLAWRGLERFHHGLAWGRHQTAAADAWPVLYRDDGELQPLPPGAFQACPRWMGAVLHCTGRAGHDPGAPADEGERATAAPSFTEVLVPRTGQRVRLAGVSDLRVAPQGWLWVRQGERWSLANPAGGQRVPAQVADREDVDWLDDQVVRVTTRTDDRKWHQLWSLATGSPLSERRQALSWRVGPGRYLIAGARQGLSLVDAGGRELASTPWLSDYPQFKAGWLWVNHGPQAGSVDAAGRFTASTGEPEASAGEGGPAAAAAADARAVRGWTLRLASRCGQLIVQDAQGRQTWPTAPVACGPR
ncbi:MAG: hypothetical protein RI907_2184 [Pseudomonadota bacterium]|jgi:hypothetical protein